MLQTFLYINAVSLANQLKVVADTFRPLRTIYINDNFLRFDILSFTKTFCKRQYVEA